MTRRVLGLGLLLLAACTGSASVSLEVGEGGAGGDAVVPGGAPAGGSQGSSGGNAQAGRPAANGGAPSDAGAAGLAGQSAAGAAGEVDVVSGASPVGEGGAGGTATAGAPAAGGGGSSGGSSGGGAGGATAGGSAGAGGSGVSCDETPLRVEGALGYRFKTCVNAQGKPTSYTYTETYQNLVLSCDADRSCDATTDAFAKDAQVTPKWRAANAESLFGKDTTVNFCVLPMACVACDVMLCGATVTGAGFQEVEYVWVTSTGGMWPNGNGTGAAAPDFAVPTKACGCYN